MSNQLPDDSPTIRTHKRQFAWQILAPFLVMAGLIIAGAVLVVTGGTARTGVWADVSLVWLLVPALLIAFGLIIVTITIIYGMSKILQIIPHYTGRTQIFFDRVSAGTRRVADGATQPFIWTKQAGAALKTFFKR
jgi:hypothetical protein